MNRLFVFIALFFSVLLVFVLFPELTAAITVSIVVAIVAVYAIDNIFEKKNAEFLRKIFIGALVLRCLAAILIYAMELDRVLGPDAITFDRAGQRIVGYFTGELAIDSFGVAKAINLNNPGWGMNYFVAFFYYLSGPNPLAIQFVSSSLGACVVPSVYYCANKIFHNVRVAKYSAIFVAFAPAMILWSSQMLKDGIIVFLLALSMACVIKLHEKFDKMTIIILIGSLLGLYSLRFYIFFMVVAATVGSFVIGAGSTSESIGKRLGILLLLGMAVTYVGASRGATTTFERYSNLERLQEYREEQARVANSGFGEDIDITTVEGTVTILPLGVLFILFAPFPWHMTSPQQLMTAPEMLLWWLSIPFLIKGIWYTIKHRLRGAISILTFTAMLTAAYALFQGNIGTAYRQRTQIQVFLFIFVAVGWTLYKEQKENSKLMKENQRKRFVASR